MTYRIFAYFQGNELVAIQSSDNLNAKPSMSSEGVTSIKLEAEGIMVDAVVLFESASFNDGVLSIPGVDFKVVE